ncbi:uncharacterized protein KRP23_11552 [Phytophthora ramorum]|uniref:uncharacterized protein n=1 Tax=Phytophthora ramorum TaxID=164328 RepID=UPI0030AD672A|nr:hypothetical protein KRP23_11552 [Phytophthora ramorum]
MSSVNDEDFFMDDWSMLAFLVDYDTMEDNANVVKVAADSTRTSYQPPPCLPTTSSPNSASSVSSPEKQSQEKKKSWRQRRKDEILTLREVVKQLSTELERRKMTAGVRSTLPTSKQTTTPTFVLKAQAAHKTEAALLWEKIAGRQSMLRHSSEGENAKLRKALTQHLQQAKSLQRFIKRKLREDMVSTSVNLIRQYRLDTRGVTPPLNNSAVFDELMMGLDDVYQGVDNFFERVGMDKLPCPGRRNNTGRRRAEGVFVEFLDKHPLPFNRHQTEEVIWGGESYPKKNVGVVFLQNFAAGNNTRMRSSCSAFVFGEVDVRVVMRAVIRKYVEGHRTVFIKRTLIEPIVGGVSVAFVETSRLVIMPGDLSILGPSSVMQTHREASIRGTSTVDLARCPSLEVGVDTWESKVTCFNNDVEDQLIRGSRDGHAAEN